MKKEIIKEIPGYEGLYKISNYGDVFSVERKVTRLGHKMTINGRKLLNSFTIHGYAQVKLYKETKSKTFLVHRLVLISFAGLMPGKDDVNHINSIRYDNRLENLEWCTRSENILHSFRHGNKSAAGSKNNFSILNEANVLEIKNLFKTSNKTNGQIGSIYGVDESTISKIRSGKNWSHI